MTDTSASHAPSRVTTAAADRQLRDALWRGFDQYRGALSLAEFGDALLSLVYLRGRPVWTELVDGGLDVEQAILNDLSTDGEDLVVVRPLLDSVRKVGEARQLAPLVDLAARLGPDADVPPTRIFSTLLDRISLEAGRTGGEFYTPESITSLVAALLNPRADARILDPCCKTGGFPAAIADRLTAQGKTLDRLTVDISDYSGRSSALAFLNLRLRGITPRVLPSPSRSLPIGTPNHRYDVVTANPPFNLKHWDGDGQFHGSWRYGAPPTHNANFAWLQYVVASLDRGGQAAAIMPAGAGFAANARERKIRAAMIDDGVVSAIIALPAGMFTNTAIPVTLWLLQHPSGDWPGEVLFVDATDLGSAPERGRRTLDGSDIDKIAETYREWREGRCQAIEGFATGVPVNEIRAGEYRLNPRAYITPVGIAPDPGTRVRQVADLAERLEQLAEQAARIDRTIQLRLEELSL